MIRLDDPGLPRPSLDDMPISPDVRVDGRWPESMQEMAAHIGAYATLLLHDAVGGQDRYIPLDPDNWMVPVIGAQKAAVMSRIYGRERLSFPTASRPLRQARRAAVLAAIRAGQISVNQAAQIRGMGSRTFISQLLNHTPRDPDVRPALPRRDSRDARQLCMFDGDGD